MRPLRDSGTDGETDGKQSKSGQQARWVGWGGGGVVTGGKGALHSKEGARRLLKGQLLATPLSW